MKARCSGRRVGAASAGLPPPPAPSRALRPSSPARGDGVRQGGKVDQVSRSLFFSPQQNCAALSRHLLGLGGEKAPNGC